MILPEGVIGLSRNVTIVVIILIIVLLAAYLVWLRARFATSSKLSPSPAVLEVNPSLEPTPTATVSAAPAVEATKSGQRSATTSGRTTR